MSSQPTKIISEREQALIEILHAIVVETMDYPPIRPINPDSFLPAGYVAEAQKALKSYGRNVKVVEVAG